MRWRPESMACTITVSHPLLNRSDLVSQFFMRNQSNKIQLQVLLIPHSLLFFSSAPREFLRTRYPAMPDTSDPASIPIFDDSSSVGESAKARLSMKIDMVKPTRPRRDTPTLCEAAPPPAAWPDRASPLRERILSPQCSSQGTC